MKLTLEKLYSEIGYVGEIENLDEILNSEPKKEWLKEHPQVNGFMYLPIEKVEFLLSRLFTNVKIEIRSVVSAENRAVVTVRVHYGKDMFHDGIGAAQINKLQTAEMCFPLAKSLALKDAIEFKGKIFGKDLNRASVSTVVKPKTFSVEQEQELAKIELEAKKAISIDDLNSRWKHLAIPQQSPIFKAAKALFTKQEVNLD